MAYPGLLHPEPLSLQESTADPYLHRRHSNTVLSQSLWSPWVLACIRFVWALLASLAGMGFDSKCEFAPLPILLGLLLCPWTQGISSQSLQHLPSYWDFSDLGRGVSPLGYSSTTQPPLATILQFLSSSGPSDTPPPPAPCLVNSCSTLKTLKIIPQLPSSAWDHIWSPCNKYHSVS